MNYIKNLWKGKTLEKIDSRDTQSHIKMNIKGQQVVENNKPFNPYSFKYEKHIKDGPTMLNTRTRLRIWVHVGLFFVYCFLLYKLMVRRLKVDDLDIMEREVKEEFEIKRKIKEISN